MALEVEDGTGKANAESYSSVAEFDAYWALRTTDPIYVAATLGSATTTQKEEALRVATQEADAENEMAWKGSKGSSTQALDWPRTNAYDADGYAIDSTSLPEELKSYINERAARYIANIATGLMPDLSSPVGSLSGERLKAGPVEIDSRFSGGAGQSKQFPKLAALLRSLIDYDGTTIIRA